MPLFAKFDNNLIYNLENGVHTGKITDVGIVKERMYLSIQLDNNDKTFRPSFPAILTTYHPMTQLICLNGIEEENIPEFDLEELKGTKISFETEEVEKADKVYCNAKNFDILE